MLLRGLVNSRSGTRSVQSKTWISYHSGSQENSQSQLELCQKDSGVNMNRLQRSYLWILRMITVIYWNTSNVAQLHTLGWDTLSWNRMSYLLSNLNFFHNMSWYLQISPKNSEGREYIWLIYHWIVHSHSINNDILINKQTE